MRVFIGIKLDKASVERVNRCLKPFKKIATPLKWTKDENIHLTVKFLGEVAAEKYRQIEQVLSADHYDVVPFTMKITGLGKFGRGGGLNILWAGVEKNENLEKLFHKIEKNLHSLKIEKEERPFKPHITLARNKREFNWRPIFQLLEENRECPIAQLEVKGFQIFKSDLASTGPTYTLLKEIPLVQS
jgi:2'-5' RNA ligase